MKTVEQQKRLILGQKIFIETPSFIPSTGVFLKYIGGGLVKILNSKSRIEVVPRKRVYPM